MTDGSDPATWPTPRGPWPEVHDLNRLFDHGQPWCVNAAGHPGISDYPDISKHQPWDECHGPQVWLEGVRLGLDDDLPLDVSVFAAAPYRFGQLRPTMRTEAPARLFVEAWDEDGDLRSRWSVGLGEATRLARVLNRLVDDATPLNYAS